MDIFEDSCDHDDIETLELERFKTKVKEIWTRMLELSYDNNPPEDMDKEHYMEHNALRFADEPEVESEEDNLMAMLKDLINPREELEDVKLESKAPKYGNSTLKSNNETGKKEATNYEYNHTSSKTPSDSRSGNKGGSYSGTPSGSLSKAKEDTVIRSFTPVAESLKEELISLIERQRIGKRRQLFRA